MRLGELNISHNHLTAVTGLESLSSLKTLDLASNHLNTLSVSRLLRQLCTLKLSNNQLRTLNVSMFSSLSLLYLDRNFLSTVSGLEQCTRLESLSIRDQQQTGVDIDLGLVKDIRKVYLSSNRISPQTLSPSVPLLDLQLLDVASCAVHKLPSDFAAKFPNVKVLNLNFNSLSDLDELATAHCLGRLAVAGNRIARMRKLCQVITRMAKGGCVLCEIDLRGNPLTVGFHAPLVTGSGRMREKTSGEGNGRTEAAHDWAITTQKTEEERMSTMAGGNNDEKGVIVQVNDPYTLPLADPVTDREYLSTLDESTRLRRKVLELMLYVGSRGSIKVLDGLALQLDDGDDSDVDRILAKLEDLGVLKPRQTKKSITE